MEIRKELLVVLECLEIIVLTTFRNTLNSMIKTGGPVPVNINIKNNPNNNGRSGAKVPNVNE
jgi:hypothetical protein